MKLELEQLFGTISETVKYGIHTHSYKSRRCQKIRFCH